MGAQQEPPQARPAAADDAAMRPLVALCGPRDAARFSFVEARPFACAVDLAGAPPAVPPLVHVYRHEPTARTLCVSLGPGGAGLRCWDLLTQRQLPQAVAVGALAG